MGTGLLQALANLATVLGFGVAAWALWVAALQAKGAAHSARAALWLQLRRMFLEYRQVHENLRPGGAWTEPGAGPTTRSEWVAVEEYMGLFEHCEIMLQQRLIDWPTFKRIYAYRVRNVVANEEIKQKKLVEQKGGWTDFLALVDRVSASR